MIYCPNPISYQIYLILVSCSLVSVKKHTMLVVVRDSKDRHKTVPLTHPADINMNKGVADQLFKSNVYASHN